MQIGVTWTSPELKDRAQAAAETSGLPCASQPGNWDFSLEFTPTGIQLQDLTHATIGPVKVDFESGISQTRQKTVLAGSPLAKAIGYSPKRTLHVFDATAGLGRDMMDLLTLGFQVTACESHPILFALLQDGIERLRKAAEFSERLSRLSLVHGNSLDILKSKQPDVIYLDPMFPERETSASPKKEMQYFRKLLGPTPQLEELFQIAVERAQYRVVVKRPPEATPLGAGLKKPTHSFETKLVRFDMYSIRPF